MLYTTNLNLKKPEYADPADVADINDNMDAIDQILQDIIDAPPIPIITTAGTANDYTASMIGVEAYADGLVFFLKPHTNCATNATLNINGLGAVTLYRAAIGYAGSNFTVLSNSLVAGHCYLVMYSASAFRVMSISSDIVRTDIGQILTNKKIVPRASSVASTATLSINIDSYDIYTITAQAAALTIANPTGTVSTGLKLLLRIKDNGTSRAISWGTNYSDIYGFALPTATVAGKQMILGFIYDSVTTKWEYVSRAIQA